MCSLEQNVKFCFIHRNERSSFLVREGRARILSLGLVSGAGTLWPTVARRAAVARRPLALCNTTNLDTNLYAIHQTQYGRRESVYSSRRGWTRLKLSPFHRKSFMSTSKYTWHDVPSSWPSSAPCKVWVTGLQFMRHEEQVAAVNNYPSVLWRQTYTNKEKRSIYKNQATLLKLLLPKWLTIGTYFFLEIVRKTNKISVVLDRFLTGIPKSDKYQHVMQSNAVITFDSFSLHLKCSFGWCIILLCKFFIKKRLLTDNM